MTFNLICMNLKPISITLCACLHAFYLLLSSSDIYQYQLSIHAKILFTYMWLWQKKISLCNFDKKSFIFWRYLVFHRWKILKKKKKKCFVLILKWFQNCQFQSCIGSQWYMCTVFILYCITVLRNFRCINFFFFFSCRWFWGYRYKMRKSHCIAISSWLVT